MRKMTKEEQEEYNRLTAHAEQIRLDIDALVNKPVTYGYARVSSRKQADGNSLEAQRVALEAVGAEVIYKDIYTGTVKDRPELDRLLAEIRPGDTLIITKLDRIARSVQQGISLIDGLAEKGVRINVLNMGVLDGTPTGKLIRNVLLSFAEFERDMIMERTREGREIARQRPDHREGRKPKYTPEQLQHALDLLTSHTYSEVVRMTGISKSTLIRAMRRGKIS